MTEQIIQGITDSIHEREKAIAEIYKILADRESQSRYTSQQVSTLKEISARLCPSTHYNNPKALIRTLYRHISTLKEHLGNTKQEVREYAI